MIRTTAIVASIALVTAAGMANACASGAKCLSAYGSAGGGSAGSWHSAERSTAPVEVGTTLPMDYMILANTKWYGLPPVGDGWRYYRVERDIYRVENGSRKVLERVTHWASKPLD